MIPESEYDPYYKGYINLSGEGDLTSLLENGLHNTVTFFESLTEGKLNFAYAANKWTPKEILLHLIDTERVFAYRALRFAREAQVNLPGFDQDEFVENSQANNRPLKSLLEEYKSVRESSISLFKSFCGDDLLKKGTASNSEMSVRAVGAVLCGHEKHHIQIIEERYLQ